MAIAPEEIGTRIRQARLAKGWTHEELAAQMGVGLRTAQRWQTGRNPKTGESWLPRVERLMELADLLEVPASYFVDAESPFVTLGQIRERLAGLEDEVRELRADLAERERDEPDAAQGSQP